MARGNGLQHYLRWRWELEDPFVELDLGHSGLDEEHLQALAGPLQRAVAAMAELEAGAIANASENRRVGHYWLRAPGLAPEPEIEDAIRSAIDRVEDFAARVHRGALAPPEGGAFSKVCLIGIGGSALGPMLLGDCFGGPQAPMALEVLDNTDPEGIDRCLARLGSLADTLVLVVSKSGGTPETRNAMLEVRRACADQGLDFAPRAVAITGEGSALHDLARQEGWLATFPIQDWVGGRTSITSPVGLLPGALLGVDVRSFLAGAAAMDAATRQPPAANPAAQLAAFWHVEGGGRGERAMVVLPYKDRLLLLSRYLQQLVMESLGKRCDRQGREVHQGLTVYGNKGSTDQHAFVQQLRDGRHDFFVQFVRVLHDRDGPSLPVTEGATAGDYLDGFWQGTRDALFEAGRHSATLVLDRIDARSLGALIALFERAVGLYAELIDINAYDQPGVEAGKKAAAAVLERQARLLSALDGELRDCAALADRAGVDPAEAWPILCHLAANRQDVQQVGPPHPERARFRRG